MPANVGAVKVNNVSSSAVFNIGDVFSINPVSSAKTYTGGGSFNTGNGTRVQISNSYNYVYDKDIIDQETK
ncbi:spore germination protein [Ornithinibacillus bavariensis]|uniref:Germination protein PA n=1 Tax=Ornithinibacillus bavariensis TaxID=545502 RepID=A0A920C6I5_9BACI|nr:spore germination protein [Ornithinibacillus bavariensis]GIO25722.1 germination protein PA [Ornithinibacillus bavariensis]HAM79872.1 spore gernimation protein GerPA [Ornithinibacillus sp.]